MTGRICIEIQLEGSDLAVWGCLARSRATSSTRDLQAAINATGRCAIVLLAAMACVHCKTPAEIRTLDASSKSQTHTRKHSQRTSRYVPVPVYDAFELRRRRVVVALLRAHHISCMPPLNALDVAGVNSGTADAADEV